MRRLLALVALALAACTQPQPPWSDAERAQVGALSLSRLPPPPADPSNAHADDPAAAALGAKLFADPKLSANGEIACASCHQPQRAFTDGLPVARGLGTTQRNAPSLLAAAWSPWLFWDGRADSLWAQAIGPLTHPDEMGMTPTSIAAVVAQGHKAEFEQVFGKAPREPQAVMVQAAKALAAFVRTLRPPRTRFDAFADALAAGGAGADTKLTANEQTGLRLFLGKAQCLRCHHGPLFTNEAFHNTGLAPRGAPPDRGRAAGAELALESEYNCRGRWSDARERRCPNLDYLRVGAAEQVGAFKTPSLRSVALTAPYMHDGRFATVREVLDHYTQAPQLQRAEGHTELFPLALSPAELDALEAFLGTLSPLAPAPGAE